MTLIFTLDDDNGTNLAGKRQSRDRVVGEKILELTNNCLSMLPKTLSFFKNNDMANVSCNILNTADAIPADTFFFSETVLPDFIMQKAEKIYVFRWNRRYPSMMQDRVNLSQYHREVIDEFPGYSHEKITLEVYTK